ncbi:MAG: winged helix-turn-helix domain-containing tetratricopeptide repeat protein [Vicinamibacterales bacterium]
MGRRVEFRHFQFDPAAGRLWTGQAERHLTPKAAAVLAELVTHAGEPVSKDDLFAAVWPDTAVTNDALTTCIAELRRVLEDDARDPRFIETRHRRGYRFVAPVTSIDTPAASVSAAPDAASPVGAPAAAAAPAPDPSSSTVATIAVLPFTDMSPARDQEYLCDGLADELINALSQVEGLRVASRSASFRFRTIGTDLQAVSRQLGVGALLEGSVRKADTRLRVTVQLTDAATGYHRWSRRFDRAVDDVFAIQEEIAESVVLLLRGGGLSPREQASLRRPSANSEAYEHYLRGRQFLFRQTREGLTDSVRMFERAVAVDDAYAPAFAGLAMAHAALYEWFGSNEADRVAAERASARGLALAPHLADAHVARGCALTQSRRYEEAAAAFEAAIALNGSLFEAFYYYARSSFAAGAVARSADLFRMAAAARREDYQSALLAAQSLRIAGRDDEAHELRVEGIARAERALQLNPTEARALSLVPGYLLAEGQTARALEWADRALTLYPDDMSTLINIACLYARMGRKDGALDLLERAVDLHGAQRDWIEHDTDYDSLRDDPRFQRLLARLT